MTHCHIYTVFSIKDHQVSFFFTQLKKVMKWMVFVSYHSKLEISFCMDEFALPVSKSQTSNNAMTTSLDDLSISMEVHQPSPAKTSEQSTPDEVEPLGEEEVVVGEADDICIPTVPSGFDVCQVEKGGNGVQEEPRKGIEECEIVVNFPDSERHENKGNGDVKRIEPKVNKEVVIIQEKVPFHIISQESNEKLDVCENKTESFMRNPAAENESQNSHLKGVRPSSAAKHPVGLEVSDQSDPLYNYQKNKDDTIFFSSHTLQEKSFKHCQKFKKLLKEVILSVSPFISYELPYLETESGSMCINRKFFSEEIYWSQHFEPQTWQETKKMKDADYQPPLKKPVLRWSTVEVVEAHPLVVSQLSLPFTDKKMQVGVFSFSFLFDCVRKEDY